MPFVLPPLPYAYDALEPHIDAKTMQIHHDKHHQAYIDNLNKALEGHPELEKKSVIELLTSLPTLPESIRTAVRNNGGGHLNHSEFWHMMAPAQTRGSDVLNNKPTGTLANALEKKFGSFEKFQELFNAEAKKVFGSGWAWLCVDENGDLFVTSTPNQDTPLSQGKHPVLALDVWEHAYYLKYQNKRPDYISQWWFVVNWPYAEEKYHEALKKVLSKK